MGKNPLFVFNIIAVCVGFLGLLLNWAAIIPVASRYAEMERAGVVNERALREFAVGRFEPEAGHCSVAY